MTIANIYLRYSSHLCGVDPLTFSTLQIRKMKLSNDLVTRSIRVQAKFQIHFVSTVQTLPLYF